MLDQDSYRTRAAKAVVDALIEAGRRPGASEVEVSLGETMDALCQAVVLVAATSARFDRERAQAVATVEAFEKHVSTELQTLAARIREGMPWPAGERPTLHVVK